eukprot:TRINITY_DN678505_c0_g4_i1.p1 TRINITY_DN678505_c0_g4~~TRINITY_DN678505_c0_g4_i1.p1  ORF type:complete len:1248 (-),score=403.61 TRINITY_DN678505_c0_g4_i1:1642-5385(-)
MWGQTDSGDEIESLVDFRILENRQQYKVHWKGTDSKEDEWFFMEDLIQECPQVVFDHMLDIYKKTPSRSISRALKQKTAFGKAIQALPSGLNQMSTVSLLSEQPSITEGSIIESSLKLPRLVFPSPAVGTRLSPRATDLNSTIDLPLDAESVVDEDGKIIPNENSDEDDDPTDDNDNSTELNKFQNVDELKGNAVDLSEIDKKSEKVNVGKNPPLKQSRSDMLRIQKDSQPDQEIDVREGNNPMPDSESDNDNDNDDDNKVVQDTYGTNPETTGEDYPVDVFGSFNPPLVLTLCHEETQTGDIIYEPYDPEPFQRDQLIAWHVEHVHSQCDIEKHESALNIQCAYRQHSSRVILAKKRQAKLEHDSAINIQCAQRTYVAKKRSNAERLRRHRIKCATNVGRVFRGHIVRRKLYACKVMVETYRNHYEKRSDSATTIQALWRGYHVRLLNWSANTIVKSMRIYHKRLHFFSVQLIQAVWKGYHIRLLQISAKRIQNAWRRRYYKCVDSVTSIASVWRMYDRRIRFLLAREAAVKIQTRMKIVLAKKLLIRKRIEWRMAHIDQGCQTEYSFEFDPQASIWTSDAIVSDVAQSQYIDDAKSGRDCETHRLLRDIQWQQKLADRLLQRDSRRKKAAKAAKRANANNKQDQDTGTNPTKILPVVWCFQQPNNMTTNNGVGMGGNMPLMNGTTMQMPSNGEVSSPTDSNMQTQTLNFMNGSWIQQDSPVYMSRPNDVGVGTSNNKTNKNTNNNMNTTSKLAEGEIEAQSYDDDYIFTEDNRRPQSVMGPWRGGISPNMNMTPGSLISNTNTNHNNSVLTQQGNNNNIRMAPQPPQSSSVSSNTPNNNNNNIKWPRRPQRGGRLLVPASRIEQRNARRATSELASIPSTGSGRESGQSYRWADIARPPLTERSHSVAPRPRALSARGPHYPIPPTMSLLNNSSSNGSNPPSAQSPVPPFYLSSPSPEERHSNMATNTPEYPKLSGHVRALVSPRHSRFQRRPSPERSSFMIPLPPGQAIAHQAKNLTRQLKAVQRQQKSIMQSLRQYQNSPFSEPLGLSAAAPSRTKSRTNRSTKRRSRTKKRSRLPDLHSDSRNSNSNDKNNNRNLLGKRKTKHRKIATAPRTQELKTPTGFITNGNVDRIEEIRQAFAQLEATEEQVLPAVSTEPKHYQNNSNSNNNNNSNHGNIEVYSNDDDDDDDDSFIEDTNDNISLSDDELLSDESIPLDLSNTLHDEKTVSLYGSASAAVAARAIIE